MGKICDIRIGCSGWHYKHWIGKFYPDRLHSSKMLEYYCQHFNTVELNNSFYKLPETTTFKDWHESTPSNFVFAVKCNRFITHNKKLSDPQNALINFMPRAEILEDKLGPILFQLPPKWGINLDRLEHFIKALPDLHRYTFEFRDQSWHNEKTYALLRRHNAACCVYELGGVQSPILTTADWAYVRLHGPQGKYKGRYSMESIHAWKDRIVEWSRTLKAVYVYFDNDEAAYAAHNAMELKSCLSNTHDASVS